MTLWLFILIPLLIVSLLAGIWINAERYNKSLATRLSLGAAMAFSLADSIIFL